jgi:peptidoglycan-N-acetylglucosamine deacetylase
VNRLGPRASGLGMWIAIAAGAAALFAGCSSQQRTTDSAPAEMRPVSTKATSVVTRAPVARLRVAITLDDLGATPESSDPELSRQILRELKAADAAVAVFVNCQALNDETLRLWQRAGATVGNHTATHLSLDAAGPNDTWWQDVASCDARLKDVLGAPVQYFRYPYLRYGKTKEARDIAAQKLASIDYRVAHVSAATSEWLLANYYDEARRTQDAALVRDLTVAYVEHMVDSLAAAHALAIQKTGRDVAQITLAHINRLAGDHLSKVLSAFRARGWHFISLQEALADPVYALPDSYAGGCGCSWLARIEPALTREDGYVFGDHEDQIRERFEKRLSPATSH